MRRRTNTFSALRILGTGCGGSGVPSRHKRRFSGAHGSGGGAPRATAGAEARCAEEAIERPRPDEAGSRPGDRLTPVGDRGIVASWRRRTRACLRAGRCVMKHVARAFLLAAVVLTLGGHRDALAGGCKPDGRTCRTNQSCCSRVCAKAAAVKFGMCCTPNCTGKACGDDGCGGSCGECSCGTLLLTWGVPGGTGNGELRRPGDAATDASGNIYVADADNHRIQKFDASGTFLTTWGRDGTGNGQFGNSTRVATDGSGNVYVADYFNHRIQKFDGSGTFLTTWGSLGSGNGQFTGAAGVATDGSGNVYVADENNKLIQKFDASGTFLMAWGSSGALGVATDGAGNVYVTEDTRVQKFACP